MGFTDHFSLSDYETLADLNEVKVSLNGEISELRGYLRGVKEKIQKLESEESDRLDALDAEVEP